MDNSLNDYCNTFSSVGYFDGVAVTDVKIMVQQHYLIAFLALVLSGRPPGYKNLRRSHQSFHKPQRR